MKYCTITAHIYFIIIYNLCVHCFIVELKCSKPNKRPDGLTSSTASRNTRWNTSKHTPNKHVKQEVCETIGTYLRKWQVPNHVVFWGPKWPGNLASEANSQHTSASSKLRLMRNQWKLCWENDRRPDFLKLIFGPKVAKKFNLWGLYSQPI